jgi:hypothetical protein
MYSTPASAQTPVPDSCVSTDHLLTFFDLLLAQMECPVPDDHPVSPGRPRTLSQRHLLVAWLAGLLRGYTSFAQVWRTVCWERTLSHEPVNITYMGCRQRALRQDPADLQRLFTGITDLLRASLPIAEPDLAPFAREVVALDETTLDRVRRLTLDLRQEPKDSDQRHVGKVATLFDLRRQQWLRLDIRCDVLANCKVNILFLLDGLPVGSLILADLGYFSFAWFDYLTMQGYWWVSRLREGTSYEIVQVLYEHEETFEAIIYLGKHRSDQASCPVRLVQFRLGPHLHRYITNVLDRDQLTSWEIVGLYARRWDVELAYKVIKRICGLHLWWSADFDLLMQQLWMALILSQLLQAIRVEVAVHAQVPPSEISMDILTQLLARPCGRPGPLIPTLVQFGRLLKLIRPDRRHQQVMPAYLPEASRPEPQTSVPPRHAHYAQCKNGTRSSTRIERPPRFSFPQTVNALAGSPDG